MKNVSKPLSGYFRMRNYSKEIQSFVLKENTHRIRMIAWVGAVVNMGVTIATLLNSYYGPLFLKSEVYYRLIWIALSGLYLIVSSHRYYEKVKKVFNIINIVTVAGSLILAAFVSAMPFADHSYLIVFYANMLLMGTLLYLSNIEMCLITVPSLCVISAIYVMYPESVMHQESNYINVLSVTFFSFVMAYVNYSAKRTQFNAMKIIEAQHKELYRLATIDELTGLSNRRSINEALERVMEEFSEFRKPLGLLMVDIDYFKQFNDFYGHLQGDTCLTEVAKALKELAEFENGLVGRFGGEEFLVILPDRSEGEVMEFAERLCSAISGLDLPHEPSQFNKITISVGVATRSDFENTTSAELIERADRALYKAKTEGRNRVVV